jgi:oxygen-dependent protoporphyrinogen oxidase
MPRFIEMERASGSVMKAMLREQRGRARSSESGARWSLFLSLAGGMQELVDALASRLPEGSVRVGKAIAALSSGASGRAWTLRSDGDTIEADSVILATPAYTSAALLNSLAPDIAAALARIPYSSTATLSLAYRKSDIPREFRGFGLIAPAIEKRKLLACTFSSIKYTGRAPDDCLLMRAFIGGALQPGLFDQDDAALEASVRGEIKELLEITADPLFTRLHRHPRAMPQYPVGHLQSLRRIEERVNVLPPLRLAGNAYYGVGIADCVHSGEKAAEEVVAALATSPA